MSEYTDQLTRELLALTSNAPDVRQLLSEAWYVGFHAGRTGEDVHSDPFRNSVAE